MTRPTSLGGRHEDASEPYLAANVRDGYMRLMEAIEGLGSMMWSRASVASASAAAEGVALGDEPLAMDWIPRLVTKSEWVGIARGVEQRMRAFVAFLEKWRNGSQTVVPEPLLVPYAGDQLPDLPVGLHVYAPDLIRDGTGRLLVIEDNLGHPAAQHFATVVRRYQRLHFPELIEAVGPIREPTSFGACLRLLLTSIAGEEGEYVWLWPGRHRTPAWFEVSALASDAGCRILTTDEVRLDRHGWLVHGARSRRIDAVHVQLWEGDVSNEMLRAAAAAKKTVVLSGHHDRVPGDKAMLPFVPAMIRDLLGEKPILGQAPSLWFGEPGVISDVFDDVGEWVVKRRLGVGGRGVLIGRNATPDELVAWRRAIREDPAGFVAQRFVEGSTLWSLDTGRAGLTTRHIDLRAYALRTREPRTIPLGLTRITPPDSHRTSLLQPGAALKDTWILDA